jgi:hypothetical protein
MIDRQIRASLMKSKFNPSPVNRSAGLALLRHATPAGSDPAPFAFAAEPDGSGARRGAGIFARLFRPRPGPETHRNTGARRQCSNRLE